MSHYIPPRPETPPHVREAINRQLTEYLFLQQSLSALEYLEKSGKEVLRDLLVPFDFAEEEQDTPLTILEDFLSMHAPVSEAWKGVDEGYKVPRSAAEYMSGISKVRKKLEKKSLVQRILQSPVGNPFPAHLQPFEPVVLSARTILATPNLTGKKRLPVPKKLSDLFKEKGKYNVGSKIPMSPYIEDKVDADKVLNAKPTYTDAEVNAAKQFRNGLIKDLGDRMAARKPCGEEDQWDKWKQQTEDIIHVIPTPLSPPLFPARLPMDPFIQPVTYRDVRGHTLKDSLQNGQINRDINLLEGDEAIKPDSIVTMLKRLNVELLDNNGNRLDDPMAMSLLDAWDEQPFEPLTPSSKASRPTPRSSRSTRAILDLDVQSCITPPRQHQKKMPWDDHHDFEPPLMAWKHSEEMLYTPVRATLQARPLATTPAAHPSYADPRLTSPHNHWDHPQATGLSWSSPTRVSNRVSSHMGPRTTVSYGVHHGISHHVELHEAPPQLDKHITDLTSASSSHHVEQYTPNHSVHQQQPSYGDDNTMVEPAIRCSPMHSIMGRVQVIRAPALEFCHTNGSVPFNRYPHDDQVDHETSQLLDTYIPGVAPSETTDFFNQAPSIFSLDRIQEIRAPLNEDYDNEENSMHKNQAQNSQLDSTNRAHKRRRTDTLQRDTARSLDELVRKKAARLKDLEPSSMLKIKDARVGASHFFQLRAQEDFNLNSPVPSHQASPSPIQEPTADGDHRNCQDLTEDWRNNPIISNPQTYIKLAARQLRPAQQPFPVLLGTRPLQSRALAKTLRAFFELEEQEGAIQGADMVLSAVTAVMFRKLSELQWNSQQLLEDVQESLRYYRRVVLFFEVMEYGSNQKIDPDEDSRNPLNLILLKALPSFRRAAAILSSKEGLRGTLDIVFAINGPEEVSRALRNMAEDEFEILRTTMGDGPAWDLCEGRQWLRADENDKVKAMITDYHFNSFSALYIIHRTQTLERFALELDDHQRLKEFGPVIGEDAINRFNEILRGKLAELDGCPDDTFSSDPIAEIRHDESAEWGPSSH